MGTSLSNVLKKLSLRQDLSAQETEAAFTEIMEGEATPAQIGGLLMALRVKGETKDEILGAARAMRKASVKIPVKIGPKDVLMDTCGTGGDASHTFNISTAVAFVVAACGVKVAKHGNRSITSRSGSADCLEALGKDLNLTPEQVAKEIEDVGIGFLFAPNLHPAMRYAAGPRKELGVRTIFNVLGPLTNPAQANYQLMGVFDGALLGMLANVLGELGLKRAWVVHGEGGLDEMSILGPTKVAQWNGEIVEEFEVTPEDAGLNRARLDDIRGGDAVENAQILKGILAGEIRGPKLDIVLLNAGAALVVAGKAGSIETAVEMAKDAIGSGRAKEVLDAYIGYHH